MARSLSALRRACGATEEAKDHDSSFTSAEGIRFRVNLLRQLGRHAAVLRRIRSDIPDLETLGLPAEVLREWIARKSGLVLICGPTGSGKSTTLASCLEWMNQALCRHVVTIEDPIEYLFANRQCLFTQREVGIDTPSFAEGLRRSLRQSPDVILVGEIRDAETAMTAAQACRNRPSCPLDAAFLQLHGCGRTVAIPFSRPRRAMVFVGRSPGNCSEFSVSAFCRQLAVE